MQRDDKAPVHIAAYQADHNLRHRQPGGRRLCAQRLGEFGGLLFAGVVKRGMGQDHSRLPHG